MTEPVAKRADQLVVGDRILHHSLPTSFFSEHGDVVFVRRYEHHGAGFVFVAYWQESGYESTTYVADGVVKVLPADPTGQLYSRADDGETTQPIGERRLVGDAGVWAVPVAGGGIEIDPPEGFVPASNGLTPAGLTKAADESRGPLAGTTPVVTYFSFGHDQRDPDTRQKLLDHYVTVVAPTYDACREAMFASRFGREWSFDYLAGTVMATEWVALWTEHEVIVAPGTDRVLAELALEKARDLLTAANECHHGPECPGSGPDCGRA